MRRDDIPLPYPAPAGSYLCATDLAAALLTQDRNALNAMHMAHRETHAACEAIRSIPQAFEEDVLLLLHGIQCLIERNSNMHLDLWQEVCERLADEQTRIQRSIDERVVVEPVGSPE